MVVMRRFVLMLVLLAAIPVAAQVGYIGGKNKITYDKFDWHVYDTPHFRISYYDRVEPALDEVASFAESAYDELARRLNFQILDPIPLIIYATHAEFEQTNIIVGFIPEGVGAFATSARNRMVLPVDLSDHELQTLIQHELTHIFQYEILFQGRRGRAIFKRPPTWYMEGMASYLGRDEVSLDEAYMRDAALSGNIPSVAAPVGGFYAYRFGHMVFEFVESEWGEDGLRDFIFAFRNTMSGNITRPLERTFKMSIDEFDAIFRKWLRQKYEPYAKRGEPREFGQPFYTGKKRSSVEVSPIASPNGDLVAAFTSVADDIDVAVFGVPDRKLFKNVTKGYTTKYRYLIAQGLTIGPRLGRDIAFSPDGKQLAVFARSERTRNLLILDIYKKKIVREIEIPLPIDQPSQPAWAPDGGHIAFHATLNGQYDIFQIALDGENIIKLTDDEAFDGAPVYSPDGSHLVFSTQENLESKLGRLKLDGSGEREQMTFGPGSDDGASFSRDGKRLYFASDRSQGVWDIYFMDFEDDALYKVTNVIGAAINPTPIETLEGERVVYQAFAGGSWKLYVADPNQAEEVAELVEPKIGLDLEDFLPAVSLSVDPSRGKKVKRRKLFVEDAAINIGVDQEGQLLSYTYVTLADQYGDRRISVYLNSVSTFGNFQAFWTNLEKKTDWGVFLYDARTYYVTGYDPLRDTITGREEQYRRTGGAGFASYPLSTYYRLEASVGYEERAASLPVESADGFELVTQTASVPLATFGIVGDTTKFNYYGPHQGSRWRARLFFGYDIDFGGSLYNDLVVEWRKYLAISRRQELAFRVYGAFSEGNSPNVYAMGGYDTVRGYRTWGFPGNRVAFANVEWRFPLIDRLDLSFMRVGQIRGRFFADVGASWFNYGDREYNYRGQPGFQFYGEKIGPDGTVYCVDGALCDGVAAYGFGITVWLFGLPVNWDWVQRWDFSDSLGGTELYWWIGMRF